MGKKNGRPRKTITRPRVIVLALLAAYLAWPYVTLYRIATALRQGDVQTLTADIEWDTVREGIKEDIADQVLPKPVATSDDLPAFGAGFATGIAGTMVDEAVTPAHLAAAPILLPDGPGNTQALRSAWFASPTSFVASFQITSGDPDTSTIRVQLQLEDTGWLPAWRVTRIWVPMPVLEHLQTHTT